MNTKPHGPGRDAGQKVGMDAHTEERQRPQGELEGTPSSNITQTHLAWHGCQEDLGMYAHTTRGILHNVGLREAGRF